MSVQQQYILMAGGDPDDQYITTATLAELGYNIPVRFLTQSNELPEYLATHEAPVLLLLDYNATPVNAVELLKQLKAGNTHKHIPVVILSNVASPQYVKECYGLGAVSFIVKPSGMEATREKIAVFFRYWFSVAEI